MAEDKTESVETEGSELVQGLQQKLNQFVDGVHQMAAKKDLEHMSYAFFNDFGPIYWHLPEGFHLRFGLTPSLWHNIRDDLHYYGKDSHGLGYGKYAKDLEASTEETQTSTGPKHFLTVHRHVQNFENMPPNRIALDVSVIIPSDSKRQPPRLDLMMISKQEGFRELGISVHAEDIVSIEIVPDAKPQ